MMFFRSGKSPSRLIAEAASSQRQCSSACFLEDLLSLYLSATGFFVAIRNWLWRRPGCATSCPSAATMHARRKAGRQHRRQRARVQKVHKCVSDVCRVECIVVIIVQVPRFERAEIGGAAATLETPSSTNASSRSIRCSPMTVIGFAVTISAKENTSKSHLYTS